MPEERLVDGRGLSPPEPLELVMAALVTLPDDEELRVLLYCEPVPLYTLLREHGYLYSAQLLADGTNEIRIRKA